MGFTSEQEDVLWKLWAKGEPSRLIARSLRSNPSAVRAHLTKHGGVRPPARRRSRRHLTVEQREEITRGIAAGLSSRAIARSIGCAPSTVSREIARNGGRDAYRATLADRAAWERARRPEASRLESRPALLRIVRARLVLDWSPEQIAHWLRRAHPRNMGYVPPRGQTEAAGAAVVDAWGLPEPRGVWGGSRSDAPRRRFTKRHHELVNATDENRLPGADWDYHVTAYRFRSADALRDSLSTALRESAWMTDHIAWAGGESNSELWRLWCEWNAAQSNGELDQILARLHELAEHSGCWIDFKEPTL